MPVHGEATHKVRQAILFLKEFTITELADITQLDRATVETIVHRLIGDGVIVPTEVSIPASSRGRPPKVYTLTDNPQQLRQLRRAVEVFERLEAPRDETPREPESPHYTEVRVTLDALDERVERPSLELRARLRKLLVFARRYEASLTDSAARSVPYLDFAEARLEILDGNFAEGERLLQSARASFKAGNVTTQVRLIDEYIAAQTVLAALNEGVSGDSISSLVQSVEDFAIAPALIGALRHLATRATAQMEDRDLRITQALWIVGADYLKARDLLDEAYMREYAGEEPPVELLADAEAALARVESVYSDADREAHARAYIQYERVRLAYLHHDYLTAEEQSTKLLEEFTILDDSLMIRRINEFRACLHLRRKRAWKEAGTLPGERTRNLLDILEEAGYRPHNPLMTLVLHLLEELSKTGKEMWQDEVLAETRMKTRLILSNQGREQRRHERPDVQPPDLSEIGTVLDYGEGRLARD